MKVYSFIELLTAIKNGEIKDKTRIQCFANGNPETILKMRGKYIETDNGGDVTLYYNSGLFTLDDYTFELIEENTIDEIKELEAYSEDGVGLYDKNSIHFNRLKINELVRAVNKLNKEDKQ